MYNVTTAVEGNTAVSFKAKHSPPQDPTFALLGIYAKEMESGDHKKTCAGKFIAGLFVEA